MGLYYSILSFFIYYYSREGVAVDQCLGLLRNLCSYQSSKHRKVTLIAWAVHCQEYQVPTLKNMLTGDYFYMNIPDLNHWSRLIAVPAL